MKGWLIRGVHLSDEYNCKKVFYLGVGGKVVHHNALDSGNVFGNKESCRRKMCEIRKVNRLADADDLCDWSVVEVSY